RRDAADRVGGGRGARSARGDLRAPARASPPQPATAAEETHRRRHSALPVRGRSRGGTARRPVADPGAAALSTIDRILAGRSICVCAGAGGVGKTTTSAAIALGAAAEGRKVAVLTIDPARRLANSLGLEVLGNEPHRVRAVEGPGELWAMMLDAKRTFDDLVEAYAADERTRDAVLSNRIYKELSSAVSGSQEYMAMEKLYELHVEGGYDLLVLDTPPTRNALDFLDAP